MIHILSLAALGIVVVYTALLALLWRFQERVVFQPPLGVPASEVPARRVRYRAADGIELFAYVVGECGADRDVVLAFHGNADIARWLVPWAAQVVRREGVCVVLPEYRGYDGLSGPPTYHASSLDAGAALRFVVEELRVARERVVYFGHSLGTAIAAELAATAPPRTLILQAPFSSARAMAGRMFLPGLTAFWSIVSRVHFDTIARVRTSPARVWVTHGDRDFVIPVAMGREVFDAAQHKGDLLIVPGAGHNDVPEVGGEAYWHWLDRALRYNAAGDTTGARAETRSAP